RMSPLHLEFTIWDANLVYFKEYDKLSAKLLEMFNKMTLNKRSKLLVSCNSINLNCTSSQQFELILKECLDFLNKV
ncbi:MAG: hypothetical protein WBB21_00225, partial [Saprospiraceae bacterium]